jgi:cAMP phosphodiesterase
MKIRVLGCYGGQLPGKRLTSFLIDGKVLVDAGGATLSLTLEEQNSVESILVSHSHLDHIKDIPFLADNVIGMKPAAVPVIAGEPVIDALRTHFLNNRLWPDFTVIPTKDKPVLRWQPEKPESVFSVGDLKVELVAVNHPVPCFGMFITKGKKTLLYSADTGPTDRLWERARDYAATLKAIILETSFPNRLAELSLLSGHLSPCHLPTELGKLGRSDLPVYLYHFKPAFESDLNREVAELKNSKIMPLVQGETLTI